MPHHDQVRHRMSQPVRGRPGLLIASTVAGLALVTACSTSSYSDLTKVAHSVPTPAGLTFVGDARSSDAAFPIANKDVAVEYSNTTMTCAELSAAWIAALNKAHARYDPVPAGALLIYMKNSHAVVSINMGLQYEGCHHPYVGAEPKQ